MSSKPLSIIDEPRRGMSVCSQSQSLGSKNPFRPLLSDLDSHKDLSASFSSTRCLVNAPIRYSAHPGIAPSGNLGMEEKLPGSILHQQRFSYSRDLGLQDDVLIYVRSQREHNPFILRIPKHQLEAEQSRRAVYMPQVLRPFNPELTRLTLRAIPPTILVSHFIHCASGCRSRGICLHYTFLLGARHVPDGMICPICVQAGSMHEKPVQAARRCARHNLQIANKLNFQGNLPEDFLATKRQMIQCREIWQRSWECQWKNIPDRKAPQLKGVVCRGLKRKASSSDVDSAIVAKSPRIPAAGFCIAPERMLAQQRPSKRARAQSHTTSEDPNKQGKNCDIYSLFYPQDGTKDETEETKHCKRRDLVGLDEEL